MGKRTKTDAGELAKRRKLQQERRNVKARLAAHNTAVTSTNVAVSTGRLLGRKRAKPAPPLDLEAGRYRMARLPNGIGRMTGMPADAPRQCPECGAPLPSYEGRGVYRCGTARITKLMGCGHVWVGPCNPDETPVKLA